MTPEHAYNRAQAWGSNAAWLSPRGEFHPLKPLQIHEEWAQEHHGKSPEELMQAGWHRVVHGSTGILAHNDFQHPNSTQLRALKDRAIEHGRPGNPESLTLHGPEGSERRVRLARKPKANDPRAHADFARLLHEAVRPRYAETGPGHTYPALLPPDQAAHAALSDMIREITGNASDPRATVVQRHGETGRSAGYYANVRVLGTNIAAFPVGMRIGGAYATGHVRDNGLMLQGYQDHRYIDGPTFPVVRWHVPVAPPNAVGSTARVRRSYYHSFYAPMTPDELHDLIDQLPQPHQDNWRNFAHSLGWRRTGVQALARNEDKQPGAGAATRQEQSANHVARVDLARQVLSEAGLTRASVQSVLSHTDQRGVRPAVAAVIHSNASPALASYAAAWLGLLLGERRMTVFHPGDGQDVLHIIDSPHPAAQAGEYLRSAGVPAFSIQSRPAGSRVYVVNPHDAVDVETAARGLQGSAKRLTGTANRIGAADQADADSRSDFRSVIRQAEQSVSGPQKLARGPIRRAFWMDPAGNKHFVETTHEEWAEKHLGAKISADADTSATDMLWHQGWLRCVHHGRRLLAHNEDRAPTAAQLRELKDYAIETGADELGIHGADFRERRVPLARAANPLTGWWMEPDGSLHEVGEHETHGQWAAKRGQEGSWKLHGKGWLRLTHMPSLKELIIDRGSGPTATPTATQIKAAKDHALGLHCDTVRVFGQGRDQAIRLSRVVRLAAIPPAGSGGSVLVRIPSPTAVQAPQAAPQPQTPKRSGKNLTFILPG